MKTAQESSENGSSANGVWFKCIPGVVSSAGHRLWSLFCKDTQYVWPCYTCFALW